MVSMKAAQRVMVAQRRAKNAFLPKTSKLYRQHLTKTRPRAPIKPMLLPAGPVVGVGSADDRAAYRPR